VAELRSRYRPNRKNPIWVQLSTLPQGEGWAFVAAFKRGRRRRSRVEAGRGATRPPISGLPEIGSYICPNRAGPIWVRAGRNLRARSGRKFRGGVRECAEGAGASFAHAI